MIILILHTGATLFLCGLIWTVQIVHYPLFDQVGRGDFVAYEIAHQRRISAVVAPMMALELISALLLVWLSMARPDVPLPSGLGLLNLGLLALIWLSTAIAQVPQHRILSRGFDAQAHARLLRSNWLRTVVWTIRSVLLLGVLASR